MEFINPAYVAPLVSLALLWAVAVVTPGPNFFNTAQLAASCSRRHGVVASAGVSTGTIMWGLAGGLGIKSLFTAAPMLYLAFKIMGGCYLIYLGLKLFKRSAPAMSQSMLPDESEEVYGKGNAGEMWKSMMAEQLGSTIAESGGVGIAEQMYETALQRVRGEDADAVNASTDETDRGLAMSWVTDLERRTLGAGADDNN